MFDFSDDKTTLLVKDTPIDRLQVDTPPEDSLAEDGKPDLSEKHNLLLGYYTKELARQEENRRDQAIDEDYFDNIQWTEEEVAALKDRGQAPIVYNVVAQSVNWITGSEKRSRTGGARSALRPSFSRRLFERSSRSERSEFRRASRCGEHRRAPPRSGGKHPARPRPTARAFARADPAAPTDRSDRPRRLSRASSRSGTGLRAPGSRGR